MSVVTVKTPQLPESVQDALIVTWHKQPGEYVTQDENLVDLETDKVVLEVPAPESGILKEILQPEGSTVTENVELAHIEPGAVPSAPQPEAAAPVAEAAAPAATPAAAAPAASGPAHASPAVRQMLNANNLTEKDVKPSGDKNQITKADVERHISGGSAGNVAVDLINGREEKRVPMTRLRARIADRLLEAQQTAAILTTFNEVDMKPVMDLRNRYKAAFEKKHGSRLGFMSFFAQAACEALREFPEVNASIDGSDIIYHGYYDIGVAVSSKRGLVVPIIRNADQMGMWEIEQTIADFGERATNNKLALEELNGGTFSISNGGVFGSMLSTPILNPPQTAILGMHNIVQRPVVVDGEIVIRPIMYLALSYDHRLVDGKTAVSFLVTIKNILEDPARLLLQV